MRKSFPIILAASLAFGAVAAGEGADHPCYDAETDSLAYPEQSVWFHEGDSKVGNDSAAPWDTTEPETSVQGGAGAGVISPGTTTLAEGTPADTYAVFAGTFDGCLDTLAVDLYSFDPTNRSGTSGSAQPSNHNFGLTVVVDGVEVLTGGPYEGVTVHDNEGFGPNRTQFAINIGALMDTYASFGLVELDGEHEIELRFRSWYVNTNHSVYVWDTTEVPSGMTFNGEVDPETHPFIG